MGGGGPFELIEKSHGGTGLLATPQRDGIAFGACDQVACSLFKGNTLRANEPDGAGARALQQQKFDKKLAAHVAQMINW